MTRSVNISSAAFSLAKERHRRAVMLMEQMHLDVLLLAAPDNIRYATNYRTLLIQEAHNQYLCLLHGAGNATIYAPHVRASNPPPLGSEFAVDSVEPLVGWVPYYTEIDDTVRQVRKALAAQNAKTVGYDVVHPKVLEALEIACPDVRFRYLGADLMALRRVKLPEEIRLLEDAAEKNLSALNSAFSQLEDGMEDRELIAIAIQEQMARGAEYVTHFTCSTPASKDAWFLSGVKLRRGDTFFVDQVYYGDGGYCSDITQTVFLGEPDRRVSQAYQRLLEIGLEIREAAIPGKPLSELDKILESGLAKSGLEPSPYGLGHGIGLRVMEPPSLSPRSLVDRDAVLVEGEVIALEPETAVVVGDERISLKTEDCYLVQSDGVRELTMHAADRQVVYEI